VEAQMPTQRTAPKVIVTEHCIVAIQRIEFISTWHYDVKNKQVHFWQSFAIP
jgi:hypothetical protein